MNLETKLPNEEIPALIETLLATEQRLEELTGGEVDTVAGRDGRTFLLSRAQEQLRYSNAARQAAVLNALPAHIALLDSQGFIVSVNEAWRRFAHANVLPAPGYGVGLNYLTICDQARGDDSTEAHQVASRIRAVLGGGEKRFSIEYPCHSPKEHRWFLLTVTPLANDHRHGAVVMHLNISERKRDEESLRASQANMAAAQHLAHFGSWEEDLTKAGHADTKVLRWSDEMFRIAGYEPGAVEVSNELFFRLVHPDDREPIRQAVATAIREHGEYSIVHRLIRPDGAERVVQETGQIFFDETTGQPAKIVGTAHDITERKQAEAELERTHRELLEISRQAGMAEVATGILHNVGNVLNSVNVASSCIADSIRKSKAANLGRVVRLLRDHEADLGDFLTVNPQGKQIPDYLAQLAEHLVAQQSGALTELAGLQKNIEHIKDIVAMQQGFAKFSGTTEKLAVADLVEDALKMNANALARHDILVVREFQEVPLITVEKHQVLQILVNLVRNAMQACDEAKSLKKQILLRVLRGNDGVRIAVTDNGMGIPAENLTRLFAHGFTTKQSGHGFGLHSAALAAKRMGGSLTVQSDGPGQGATFTLELPYSTREKTHE